MARRISIMIDEDTRCVLGRISAAERSRAINEVLRAWSQQPRRADAACELDVLSATLPTASAARSAKRRTQTLVALKQVDKRQMVTHREVEAWARGLGGARKSGSGVRRSS